MLVLCYNRKYHDSNIVYHYSFWRLAVVLGLGEFGTVNKGVWESPMGAMDVAVKPRYGCPRTPKKIRKSPLRGHRYLDLHTPYGHEICTKVSIFRSAMIWHWVLFKEGYRKNLKIKIYPPCFEQVFFRKISLRGLQWYNIFPLVYPLWCWRNKRLKIFWQGPHLK